MSTAARLTPQTRQVLSVFLNDPDRSFYGLEIARLTGLRPGTVQPILQRFAARLWLTSRWEDIDPVEAGRAARRLFTLTPVGAVRVRRAFEGGLKSAAAGSGGRA